MHYVMHHAMLVMVGWSCRFALHRWLRHHESDPV